MTPFDALRGSDMAVPFMLDCLLKSAVLAAAALAVLLVMKRASAAARHLVLAAALAAIGAIPLLHAALPAWHVDMSESRMPAAASAGSITAPVSIPAVSPTSELHTYPGGRSATPYSPQPAPSAMEPPMLVQHPLPTRPFPWAATLIGTWGAGCLLLLARLGFAGRRLSRLSANAKAIPTNDLLQSGFDQRILPRGVRLLESSEGFLGSPVTWGSRKPVVLLPSAWRQWPADQARSALLHEAGHIARGDWALQLTALFVRALYWPNPLVWVVVKRLRQESETACDDSVLSAGITPSEYATHLLQIARQAPARSNPVALSLALLMARSTRIEPRLKAILSADRPRGPVGRGAALTAALIAAGLAAPLTSLRIGGSDARAAIPSPFNHNFASVAPVTSSEALGPLASIAEPRPASAVGIPPPADSARLATPGGLAGQPAAKDRTEWGKPVNGLEAGIRLIGGHTMARIGEPIKFAFLVRNVTDHPIGIAFANGQRMYGWRAAPDKTGTVIIAPRWRFAREERIERVVAGAITFDIPAGREVEIPMDPPECVISPDRGNDPKPLVLKGKPGDTLRIQGLPLTVIARGEEWLDSLETGVLTLNVAPPAKAARVEPSPILWGPAANGVRAGLRLERPGRRYAVGEPIWQEVYVQNRGTEPISFTQQAGFEEQGRARVTDASGQPVHVQHYYGMGGMLLGASKTAQPGEIVMVGRHSLAFTGSLLDPAENEPAPGISMAADGLPRAYAGPGRYRVRQITSGIVGAENRELITAPADVEITDSLPGGPVANGPSARPPIPELASVQVAWGKPVRGLQAGLLYLDRKNHFAAGEKVRVAVVVRNVSGKVVNFWHQVSFPEANPPVVRGDRGRLVRVRPVAETEWRPLGELRIAGVTFDMTSAPSAGGPPRTRQSEMKPGQAVIGYSLSAFLAPAIPGGTACTVAQALAVGFGSAGETETHLDTGKLPLTVIPVGVPASAAAEAGGARPRNVAGFAWGPVNNGLQSGIRYPNGGPPNTTGETLWMELSIRNVTQKEIALTYHTGSVYIDPPARVTAARGRVEVVGGNSQIVRTFRRTLKPGESIVVGSPNYLILPREPIVSAGTSPYPAIRAAPDYYAIRQDFPVEVGGRKIVLTSGTQTFHISPHPTPIAWGPVVGGFQAGLGLQKGLNRYQVGDTVGLYLYLRNAGRTPATLTYRTNGEPVTVECTQANGERADLSHMMISLLPHPTSVTLAPGEVVIISAPEVELAGGAKQAGLQRDVLVAEPGRYLFRASRISNYQEDETVPGRGAIPTGKLAVEVVSSIAGAG